MGNINQIDLIFNKSGIKSVLELNEIPFPISAWDIKTEEEFYSFRKSPPHSAHSRSNLRQNFVLWVRPLQNSIGT